jgi:predicted Zn-dependent protease
VQDYFYAIAEQLGDLLQGSEIFTCAFAGEESDFVRFNRGLIRQAGRVIQRSVSLDLIEGRRHASGELSLSGDLAEDRQRLLNMLAELRAIRSHVPEDPFLCYASEVRSGELVGSNRLPAATEMVEQVLAAGRGHDLVGIQACGAIHKGFANSFGQRNWMARYSFNLDWSLYLHTDKAVKARYAGFEWQGDALAGRMTTAKELLEALARPTRTISPGRYRVYLTPMALEEIMELLSWGGFSLRAHRVGTTPLLRMVEEGVGLHSGLTITENTANGIAPAFQAAGFIRPDLITLIENGIYRNWLISPRSAMEYQLPHNGAENEEAPLSLDIAAGGLPMDRVLAELDTGLYVGNLWYLNYSDRSAGRFTGMTRFATFWVEHGRIEAPLKVMRFDETIYHLLGDQLLGVTAERELLLDPSSYGARSIRSARLPGILVDAVNFTL